MKMAATSISALSNAPGDPTSHVKAEIALSSFTQPRFLTNAIRHFDS